ncbi:MAG: reverse transcriptase family protein [Chitinophagaceae bacterium]
MVYTLKHLYYILRSSQQEIDAVIKEIDSYYYYSEKPKKKYGNNQQEGGVVKYRKLYPSYGQLKKLQRRLNSFLYQHIEFPDYAYGSVRGKNNILNALAHRHNKYFFSVDIKDFFLNINHHMVFKMYRDHDFSPTVSHILTKLTTFKGALQQGPPTSPIIANLVFIRTGLQLQQLAAIHNVTFTAYLDDSVFSSKENFEFLVPEILKLIKKDRFYVNNKKISYKKITSEVTGIFIDKNGMLKVNSIINERAKTNSFTKQYVKRVRMASANTG